MKKPLAALVLAKMKKKPSRMESDSSEEDDYSEEEGEDMSGEGLRAAAEDVLAAFESKDSDALMEALKSFVEQC